VQVTVSFYSYLKDLTGSTDERQEMPSGSTLGELFETLSRRHPRLVAMKQSILMAVGVDYQPREYRLQEGDEVSFFPPVQGG
jgi:molybdopterin converting factor small subunit